MLVRFLWIFNTFLIFKYSFFIDFKRVYSESTGYMLLKSCFKKFQKFYRKTNKEILLCSKKELNHSCLPVNHCTKYEVFYQGFLQQMWPIPEFLADLVKFEVILNEKLHFLWSVSDTWNEQISSSCLQMFYRITFSDYSVKRKE